VTERIELPARRGGTLIVHDHGGKSDGPPVVVCHATGFCGLAYRALAAPLRSHFRVLTPDFAGHGDSFEVRGYGWRDAALDLLDLVDAVADGGPVLGVGHSFGGAVLLLAALERPGVIEAAFCYEPIVLEGGPDDQRASRHLAAAARKRRAVFSSRDEALMRYGSRPPLESLQAGVLVDYVRHGMRDLDDGTVQLKCEPEVEAANFEATDKPTLPVVTAVATPVTVATGQREGAPAMWAPKIADALPHGRLVSYDFLGHFGPLESPAAVAAGVVDAFATRRR
jgi:pimeloyl-ACP methyl ester carboxylesterase